VLEFRQTLALLQHLNSARNCQARGSIFANSGRMLVGQGSRVLDASACLSSARLYRGRQRAPNLSCRDW